MDHRPPFAAVLKRFRLAAGLTHEALAERASLGARTISDLERGVSRVPRADTLALLVAALELSPAQQAELQAAARQDPPSLDDPVTPTRRLGNLPLPLTTLVGREHETAAVRGFLSRADTRLVTLTGPGGVGKTRLALHVAAQMAEAFPDGVFVVDLAPVADRDGLLQEIGRALGTFDGRRQSQATLIAALGQKRLLLVLDNFEHLLSAAPLVTELLQGCPRLEVLATSRASLRLTGEQEFPVPPLAVPDLDRLPALDGLAGFSSVGLFVDRARRVRPEFALADDNAAAVAAICAGLDGLPLAIELAAARTRTLAPRNLLDRLQHASGTPALSLLADGPRDAPARQQTLRDTIAWSYDLLGEEDRALFRRLAVFSGGCTLDAAEAVCASPARPSAALDIEGIAASGGELNVLDSLSSLVDKNLVVRGDGVDGEPRFRMLETIRAFAGEMLAAYGEKELFRRLHADYYLAMVEATGALLFANARKRAMQAAEHGNVQAALHWLVQRG
jgi:predicted ATPase/transcriptional regulator with XRE-family HTH domain